MAKRITGLTGALVGTVLTLARIAGVQEPSVAPAPTRGYHIFLSGKARMTVKDALDGASRRLATDSCRLLFDDFTDQSGHPLSVKLAERRKAPADLLADLYYVDGDDTHQCRRDETVLLFTTPRSMVIRVCGARFASWFAANTKGGEMLLIHELLHALGLGENPPTSSQITNAVVARCASEGV